jgi:hypothetical protein
MPQSTVNPDYLIQGKHDHATGWTSVIHGKVHGTISRVNNPSVAHGITSTSVKHARYNLNGATLCADRYGRDTIVVFPGVTATFIVVNNWTDTNVSVTYGAAMSIPHPTDTNRLYPVYWVRSKTYNKRVSGWHRNGASGTSVNVFPASIPQYPPLIDPYSDLIWEVAQMGLCISNTDRTQVTTTARGTESWASPGGRYLTDSEISRKFRKEILNLNYELNSAYYERISEMHATAFDSLNRFDGNMLALIPDLKNIGQGTVSVLTNLLESATNPRKLAHAWLSGRYGDRLTYGDLRSLFEGFQRDVWKCTKTTKYMLGRSRLSCNIHIAQQDVPVTYCTRIAVQPNDYNRVMQMIREAYEWDYYPSLGNTWDLIPLSFVVDWFVNVSSIFESLDRMVQSRYYTVLKTCTGVKASYDSIVFPGTSITVYTRYLESQLSLGVSSVELGLPSAINVVDGVSLIFM